MKIKEIAIGNNEIAFIENNFNDGVNIIFSDKNNKGKTIVLQSILYVLGNVPSFPSTFDYQSYYFLLTIETDDDKEVTICRKNGTFYMRFNNEAIIFDTLTEFKYFINKNIFQIPTIVKDNKTKLVDPELYVQTFFLGQDRKDTSTIVNSFYYKKEDFYKTIFSLAGISNFDFDSKKVEELDKELNSLKQRRLELANKSEFINNLTTTSSFINGYSDLKQFSQKVNEIDKVKNILVEFNNERNRILTQKTKNEMTLKELNSLNREIKVGKLKCLDCGSSKIGYETADKNYTFDICNSATRKNIISSIETKIEIYNEEIEKINNLINQKQRELKELLKDDEISIDNLLLYKKEILDAEKIDEELLKIEKSIEDLNKEKQKISALDITSKNKAETINNNIVKTMNKIYKRIDPLGDLKFDSIFSKRSEIYSGSQAMEYYVSKLVAIAKETKHQFPIIIDAFREGELESKKEEIVLDIFKDLKKQVIISSTLKDEEYGKYDHIKDINPIDYSNKIPFHLLTEDYAKDFLIKLKNVLP